MSGLGFKLNAGTPLSLTPRARRAPSGAWTNCDLHAQVGLWAHLIPALESGGLDTEARGWQRGERGVFDYLWVLDWDVAWTGDLARILKSFSPDTADFLSFDAPRAEADDQFYTHQKLRNYLGDQQVRKALVVPARYSRRMLGAVRELVASGRHAFCETRAPSLCAEQSSWCQHKGMINLMPAVFSEYHCAIAACSRTQDRPNAATLLSQRTPPPGPGCNHISLANVWKRQAQWHHAPKRTRPPGQLLHRVQM